MKLRLLLSLTALVILAVVMLGAAEYVHQHPDVYAKEVRKHFRG
jgi:hypothetical protein